MANKQDGVNGVHAQEPVLEGVSLNQGTVIGTFRNRSKSGGKERMATGIIRVKKAVVSFPATLR